jgi:hypothetical protein
VLAKTLRMRELSIWRMYQYFFVCVGGCVNERVSERMNSRVCAFVCECACECACA